MEQTGSEGVGECLISVDVEAAGPAPSTHALLSIGDPAGGVPGVRRVQRGLRLVSMMDFSTDDLDHFRRIGRLVELGDEPGVVETALALSGSAAQSKIQTYPGDCDYFERVNILAPTRDEACSVLARLMRDKALSAASGPGYQLIEGGTRRRLPARAEQLLPRTPPRRPRGAPLHGRHPVGVLTQVTGSRGCGGRPRPGGGAPACRPPR